MWAILFSSTFCVFQIVAADDSIDHFSVSKTQMKDKLSELKENATNYVMDEAYSLNMKELTPIQIINKCTTLKHSDLQLQKLYDTTDKKCDQCYDESKQTQDIKAAEKCCKKLMAELERGANSYIDKATTCIANLAEECHVSPSDCRKMAKDIDKRVDEMLAAFYKIKVKDLYSGKDD